MLRKIISGGQTLIEPDWISRSRQDWNTGDMFPGAGRQRTGESMTGDNLVELSTTSYPARTRRNLEESDGTVIFSLERLLSGGTKLTWGLAKKLEKPLLHIYDAPKERISNPDSLCLEVQALTDFLRSNKIEVLNVAGPRESKEPGVYQLTLTILRFLSIGRLLLGSTESP
jgi:hypothetical protein